MRFEPAHLYAALFLPTTTWTFHVEEVSTATQGVVDAPPHTTGGIGTCRVARVAAWATAVASHIDCDGILDLENVQRTVPVAQPFIAGYWVATSKGLFRLASLDLDRGAPAVTHADLVLNTQPAAGHYREAHAESGSSVRTWKTGNAWCVTRSSWGGDESGQTLCFSPSKGFHVGRFYFAGGRRLELRFCNGQQACKALPKRLGAR